MIVIFIWVNWVAVCKPMPRFRDPVDTTRILAPFSDGHYNPIWGQSCFDDG